MILQYPLLEIKEESGIGTVVALLIISEQYIELAIGHRWRLVYIRLANRSGIDHFKWHIHSVNCSGERDYWNIARNQIYGIFLCINALNGLIMSGISKLLCIDQGRIEDCNKLFLPIKIGRISPVYCEIGKIDTVVVGDIFCGADRKYFEESVSFGIA